MALRCKKGKTSNWLKGNTCKNSSLSSVFHPQKGSNVLKGLTICLAKCPSHSLIMPSTEWIGQVCIFLREALLLEKMSCGGWRKKHYKPWTVSHGWPWLLENINGQTKLFMTEAFSPPSNVRFFLFRFLRTSFFLTHYFLNVLSCSENITGGDICSCVNDWKCSVCVVPDTSKRQLETVLLELFCGWDFYMQMTAGNSWCVLNV